MASFFAYYPRRTLPAKVALEKSNAMHALASILVIDFSQLMNVVDLKGFTSANESR